MTIVSVITPTYQSAHTLPRAIRSVQSQTFRNWEMIIVDDGSTDNTREVVESLAQVDSRIKYIFQENQGQAVARNRAVEVASGKYVAFLDADDEWKPKKLTTQLEIFEKVPDVKIIFTDSMNTNLVDNTSDTFSDQHKTTLESLKMETALPDFCIIVDDQLRITIHKSNFIHTSSVMMLLTVFQGVNGFNPLCRGTEDHDLWVRLAVNHHFGYLRLVSAIRYKSQESVSYRSEKWLKELIRFHKMYLDRSEYCDLHEISQAHLRSIYRSLARYYGKKFMPIKALSTFFESLQFGFDARTAIYGVFALTGPLPFVIGSKVTRSIKGIKR